MMRRHAMFVMLLLALPLLAAGVVPAHAVQPNEVLADPALEKRARNLSAGLRCLVCQNQSIDDSDAPLAGDLRRVVRERLMAKDTDAQVMDYVVARYGDFVLLKPPFKPSTLILWLTPLAVLLGGIVLARRTTRARPVADDSGSAPLSDAEKAKLERVLKSDRA